MDYLGECKLLCNATSADFLNFAPCPPPWLFYNEFRDYIISQNLSMPEVCTIAAKCKLNASYTETDCSLTTRTTDDLSSSSTARSSFSTKSPVDFTSITSDSAASTLSVILGAVGSVAAIIIFIIIVFCYRSQKKRNFTIYSKDALTEESAVAVNELELQCVPDSTTDTTTASGSEMNVEIEKQSFKTTTTL